MTEREREREGIEKSDRGERDGGKMSCMIYIYIYIYMR